VCNLKANLSCWKQWPSLQNYCLQKMPPIVLSNSDIWYDRTYILWGFISFYSTTRIMPVRCNGDKTIRLHCLSFVYPQLSFLTANTTSSSFSCPSTFIPRSHTTAGVLLGHREEIVSPKVSGSDFSREIMVGTR
jgi:hypothetical protein